MPPWRRTRRCGLRAFGGVCQSVSTSARSAMKTSVLSAHSSTGLFSRSKWPHQYGLSSRRWYPRAAEIIATAVCSGLRAARSSPTNFDSLRANWSSSVDGRAVRDGLGADRRHRAVDGPADQPVPQLARRRAVVSVVLLDLLEHDRRLVVAPRGAKIAVLRVLGDRVGRRRHVAGAQLPTHVERLERLQAVVLGARPGCSCAPTDTGRRARRCAAGRRPRPRRPRSVRRAAAERSSRRRRSDRCACADSACAAARTIFRKSTQRLPFAGAIVRPQRPEVVGRVEHPEQVLEPPLATVGRPQRVALEVEEQIALVGFGQHHQRLRVGDLVGRLAVDTRRQLQACLCGQ